MADFKQPHTAHPLLTGLPKRALCEYCGSPMEWISWGGEWVCNNKLCTKPLVDIFGRPMKIMVSWETHEYRGPDLCPQWYHTEQFYPFYASAECCYDDILRCMKEEPNKYRNLELWSMTQNKIEYGSAEGPTQARLVVNPKGIDKITITG